VKRAAPAHRNFSRWLNGAIGSALCLTLVTLTGPAAAQPVEGRTYAPGPFDSIEVSGVATVRFAQGSSDHVFIEGDDETQRAVKVELRNGLLLIRPDGAWKFWNARRAQVQVTAQDLRRLMISGAADVSAPGVVKVGSLEIGISGAGLARFDQLHAERLRFHVSGAGEGQFAGAAGDLSISVSGRGQFRGEQLMSERANVQVSGIGEVQVWATQSLGVGVSGIASVDYWGSPQITRRASGIAKVNDRGPKPGP
jgi:hypothetical protein